MKGRADTMKVPYSWLKEYVDIDISPEELQEKLFSCGFEVEELINLRAGIDRVVVGSSALVASSHSRIFGLVASARAIATRCC